VQKHVTHCSIQYVLKEKSPAIGGFFCLKYRQSEEQEAKKPLAAASPREVKTLNEDEE
jgi:hypothetical protein